MPTPTQVLVNVIDVTALAPAATVTVAHGLRQSGKSVTPTFIIADRLSSIAVQSANATGITFVNNGVAVETAKFRVEYGLSMEVDHATVPNFWTQGGVAGGAGGPPTGPAGGDLNGSNYPNPVIAAGAVDNAKISASAAIVVTKLETGAANTVLRSNGVTNVFGKVALATDVSGTLPTGNQAAQSMAGDVTGTTAAATVVKLQGRAMDATAPTTGQVIGWSGSAWGPVTSSGGGGGGGGGTYYFNYTNAGQAPLPTGAAKELDLDFDDVTPSTSTGAVAVARDTDPTPYTVLAQFVTKVGDPGALTIPPGFWELNAYAAASVITDAYIRFRVSKWDGTTLTDLIVSDFEQVTTLVPTLTPVSFYFPTTVLTSSDRLVVTIEGQRQVAAARTISISFEGNTVTHIHTTLNAPGGTGLVKVFNGVLQDPASLLTNADVDTNAGIAVTKLNSGAAGTFLYMNGAVQTWGNPPAGGVLGYTASTYPNPIGLKSNSLGKIPLQPYGSGGASFVIEFKPDDVSSGVASQVNLRGGAHTAGAGGGVNIIAGDGTTQGGAAILRTGSVTGGASSGSITLYGPGELGDINDSGRVFITSGASSAGSSGAVYINTGTISTAGKSSGTIAIYTGSATNGSVGAIQIFPGAASGATSTAGSVTIDGGQATTAGKTPGNVTINGGVNTADGAVGNVKIQNNAYPKGLASTGSLIYASGVGAYTNLAIGSTGQALIVSGLGVPSWGTLGVAGGGTGLTSYAVGDLLYADTVSTLAKRNIGSSGQFLVVSGGVPTWSNPTAGGVLTGTYPNPTGLKGTGIYENDAGTPATGYVQVTPNYDYGVMFTPPPGVYPVGTPFDGYWIGMSATNSAANLAGNGTDNPGEGGRVICRAPVTASARGAVYIQGGTSQTAGLSAGTVVIQGGRSNNTGAAGNIEIYGGFPNGGGAGGNITLSTYSGGYISIGGNKQITTLMATGSIAYASASGVLSERTIGSAGQVLTVVAGVPQWQAPGGGGGSASSGQYDAITSAASPYTTSNSNYCINVTSGSVTINLHAAATATAGRMLVIKNSGTGTITIDGNGAETIDGALTYSISTQYAAVTLMSTGSNWIII